MFYSLLPLSPSPSRLELAVLELGVATAGAVLLAAQVVETAGAVFASQTAYAKAFGGIVWDMLLLGEGLSPLAWGLLFSFWSVFIWSSLGAKANSGSACHLKETAMPRPSSTIRQAKGGS